MERDILRSQGVNVNASHKRVAGKHKE
jgi:hypothetical protein